MLRARRQPDHDPALVLPFVARELHIGGTERWPLVIAAGHQRGWIVDLANDRQPIDVHATESRPLLAGTVAGSGSSEVALVVRSRVLFDSLIVRRVDGTVTQQIALDAVWEPRAPAAGSSRTLAVAGKDMIHLVDRATENIASVAGRWLAASPDGARVLVERSDELAILDL